MTGRAVVKPAALVEALSRGLPGDRIVVDPDLLAALSHDEAEWAPVGKAAAAVRARSEAEVQHVVRACAELGAPVVPCGELLDRACLEAVEDSKHLGIDADATAMLLARVDTPGESGQAEAEAIAATMTDAGALWTEQSSDATEAEALFEARRLAYPALERLGPVLTEDVCVPRSAVPAMLEQISAIGARHGVQIATIAHAGDGNLHPLIITPAGDAAARGAAQAAFETLLDAAIAGRRHRHR